MSAAKRTGQSTAGARHAGKSVALTEERIVEATLEFIRAEGVGALSMRRLSRALGRSAMAPYWHVSDKSELLDLVARKLLSRLTLPPPESAQWDERLRTVLVGVDAHLHRYPGIADVLLKSMTSTDLNVMNGM